ncbi:MAG: 2-C-methyl-D-erythritol 4-phosphate cytidylyltransferase [Bacteroidia bacterium]
MLSHSQAVIIVAGGIGERSGQNIPKQFIEILQKPIIIYSAEKFLKYNSDIHLIIVCHKQYIQHCQKVFEKYFHATKFSIIEGGATRFHSVKNGLEFLYQKNFEGIVAIHDAARPCFSLQLVQRCFEIAHQKDNAIPVIPLSESIRKIDGDKNTFVNRENLRIVQTPQCAVFSKIYKAFQQEYQNIFTDEANVLETFGEQIHLIEGEKNNIKITYPIDFKIAEIILSNQNNL